MVPSVFSDLAVISTTRPVVGVLTIARRLPGTFLSSICIPLSIFCNWWDLSVIPFTSLQRFSIEATLESLSVFKRAVQPREVQRFHYGAGKDHLLPRSLEGSVRRYYMLHATERHTGLMNSTCIALNVSVYPIMGKPRSVPFHSMPATFNLRRRSFTLLRRPTFAFTFSLSSKPIVTFRPSDRAQTFTYNPNQAQLSAFPWQEPFISS